MVEDLAVMAVTIERPFGRLMDTEWARDGDDMKFYTVQARLETMVPVKKGGIIEDFRALEKGVVVLAEVCVVGERFGSGKVNLSTSVFGAMAGFVARTLLSL